MTRTEAIQIVRKITESATTERQIADLVDCLDALGVLKLEIEVNGLQALARAMFSSRDCLTAARVNAVLESQGFEIVKQYD